MNELIPITKRKHNILYKVLVISLMLFMISLTYEITYKKINTKQIEYKISATKIKTFSENKEKNYYIKVNYLANTITVYEKTKNGLIPVKAMICSCGESTPEDGVYYTSDKYRWHELFGNTYGQYCTRIVGHILFHSVPYTENNNPASLMGKEYDRLGEYASAGCIRLTVEDAKWIYDNCSADTEVEFYADENPGPLGKPKIFQISKYKYSNWDPTDRDKNNPWPQYINSLIESIKKDVKKSKKAVGNIIDDKIANKMYQKNNLIKISNNMQENDDIDIATSNLKKRYTSI